MLFFFCVLQILKFTLQITRMNTEIYRLLIILHFYENDTLSTGKNVIYLRRKMAPGQYSKRSFLLHQFLLKDIDVSFYSQGYIEKYKV